MTWSGSEQVAARIASTLDARDVFTFAADPDLLTQLFGSRSVRTSPFSKIDPIRRRWRWLLPLMPLWWRTLDLSSFDVVITCSHAFTNSVRTRDDAVHLSYCCTPMRYAWTWRAELARVPPSLRLAWPGVAAILRRGDYSRAQNVDMYFADSRNVADRIARFYDKPSLVVYPPVDTHFFRPDPQALTEDYFLYAGRLIAYKRPDIAVRAATRAGVNLVVAGSGPESDDLRRIAGPTVRFVPQPTGDELRDLYRRARALVFPGVEDFGMVLVEAQACATPVIAYADGGALEAVLHGKTGWLYHDHSVDGLADVLRRFEPERYTPDTLRTHAERFGPERFDRAITTVVRTLFATPPHRRDEVVRDLIEAGGQWD